jgi:hypothetical protein
MTRYVALLRGINVGGKNLIKMTELKACFEEAGFEEVATCFGAEPSRYRYDVIFLKPPLSAAAAATS